MNQERNKDIVDINEIVPTISEEEEEGLERLIENFKRLKQQNSSLLERVQLLESRERREIKLRLDIENGDNLLKVPNNSSSDPSSSISVSPDISCTDSVGDHKVTVVQVLSSSEEDLDTDYNEVKHSEKNCGYSKKYERENPDESPGVLKKCGQKEHKTAWSKMKEIITTSKVGGTKKRNIPEDTGDPPKYQEENILNIRCAGLNDSKLQTPRLVLTHPSTEDLNRPTSLEGTLRKNREKYRPTPLQPTWQETSPVDEEGQGELSPPLTRKSSKWFKVKNVFLPSPGSHSNKSTSNPSSPLTYKSFTYEVDPEEVNSYEQLEETTKENSSRIQDEVKRNYKQLQKKLSDEFHGKFVEWEKGRKCGGSFSSGNSSIDECERRRFQETEELRSYGGGPDTNMSPPERKLTTEFKKKLEEWDRLKSGNENTPSSPGREQPRRKISDWQAWGRANSQRKKDDTKKRRGSDSPSRKEGNNIKELAWIDKELTKVLKEKLRLEKEREKFNQREARLKKMKLALESRREEVLIPTSTGTFRFQGISEKFTKKLYEWEKARGIGPEASTIALLDPTYCLKITSHCSGESTGPGLMRSKSIGSIADLATPCQLTTHPSSLSLNNVELLDDSIKKMISGPNIDDLEGVSSCAITPDFSLAPDEPSPLIDSSGSDLDHEIMKLGKDRKAYQYCDESKCLIEKLKKEREMCRELEQNIESLEGRISELSKSLERIDAGSGRSCGMIHSVPFENTTREEYVPGEDCDLLNKEEMQSAVKEGLSEIWIISREQALNELHHLTEHLLLIVEKLDNWVMNSDNEPVPIINEESEEFKKLNFWMSSQQTTNVDYQNEGMIDLTSFTNIMKEKICEISRVLSYLYSKKEEHTTSLECGIAEDEAGDDSHPSYSFTHCKNQMDMEIQDTENECSSHASSFTYQVPDFKEKQYEDNWEWNKQPNFKTYQEDSFPFQHVKHLESLRENESCSSLSDLEGNISSNIYKINDKITKKAEFSVHELASPMGVLKPWDNRSDLNDDNQFEMISEMSSNIVVPTVRKIFSPVFLEENGETSFIEVVIEENTTKLEELKKSTIERTEEKLSSERLSESSREVSNSPEFINHEDCTNGSINQSKPTTDSENINETVIKIKDEGNDECQKENEELISNEKFKPDNEKESNENEETKTFFDIGFPPISPLRGRREFRSPKETSSLKRMIAARQSKRICEIDMNDTRAPRSNSSSPDSKSSEKNSELKIDKKIFDPVGSGFSQDNSSCMRAMSTDRGLTDNSETLPTKGILKSSSTSALKYPLNGYEATKNKLDGTQEQSKLRESISILEEKNKVSDQPLSTPESLRLRALKIQKAKEDFFNTHLELEQIHANINKIESKSKEEMNSEIKEETAELKQNLEQEKCFMKSASEGTINANEESHEQGQSTLKKSKFSVFSVVLRKSGTYSADSSLRRSLAIPSNHQVKQNDLEPRSCPSSPILQREEPAWWTLNPAKKIFRPKGKYKFNKKS